MICTGPDPSDHMINDVIDDITDLEPTAESLVEVAPGVRSTVHNTRWIWQYQLNYSSNLRF